MNSPVFDMRFPEFLSFSCGASHLTSVHLEMSQSGRCDLIEFKIDTVDFSSNDPLLWLKATSDRLDSAAAAYRKDLPVGFAIPGHVALAKYLKIPQVPKAKRQRIVAFEARQNVPYELEEVTWEYVEIEEDDLDFDVMIGAARTEIVEAIGKYSVNAKLDMKSIEPSTTALVNGFRFNYPEIDSCTLLISVGCKSTELIYLHGARFHSRNIPFGGQSLSIDIAEILGVPVSEGERIKQSAIEGEMLSNEEFTAFESAKQSFISRLVTEVNRTNAVTRRQGFAFDPKRCLLTGGGSVLPEIRESLSTNLQMPVDWYDTLKRINIADAALKERAQEKAMFLSDAIGHALGNFLPDAVNIDLMPRSLVWQRKFRRQQPFYIVAALVACAAIALPILDTTLKIEAYQQEIENLDAQIRPLSLLNEKIHEKNKQISDIKNVVEKAGEAAKLRSSWVRVLSDFQSRLIAVEDVWLDKLKLIRPDDPAPTGRGHARLQKEDDRVIMRLEGRLIDVKNPMSSVSPDSYQRVKALLESFRESDYVASLEDERFDYSVPGMLKFDFVLVVKPEVRL